VNGIVDGELHASPLKGYDLNLMSSGEDLPASGERSVFIQSAEDGGYVVRIFDQPDVYSDYTVSSGDLSDSIAEKFEGSSELTEKQFKEYLTSNLGHTPLKSRVGHVCLAYLLLI
jgi:hypothetical protein